MSKDKRPGGRTDDENHWPLKEKPKLVVITGGKK